MRDVLINIQELHECNVVLLSLIFF